MRRTLSGERLHDLNAESAELSPSALKRFSVRKLTDKVSTYLGKFLPLG